MSFFHALLCQSHAEKTNGSPISTIGAEEIAFWMATHRTATMFQEGGAGGEGVITPTTADDENVGTMYDLGANGLILRSPTGSTTVPKLKSDGTRNSFLLFDGSNDRIVVQNSVKFFYPVTGPSPVFSWMFWLKMNGGDGAHHRIFNSAVGTGIGIDVSRNTSNKLYFRVTDGAGTVWEVTSTQNVVVATGWVPVIIIVNGTGASAGRFIISNTEDKTFTVTAGSSTESSVGNLFIGTRSSSSQFLNGSLGDVIIVNRVITAGEIAEFIAYNPTRSSEDFAPILANKYDFNDNTYIFSDTAGTTPAVNGDPVRLVRNMKVSNFGDLFRNLNSASSGVSPVFRTNIQNGKNCLEWDGVDDTFTFDNTIGEDIGGKNTWFLIMKNDDTTFGSHAISGNNAGTVGDYVVLTGSSYGSPAPGSTNPYFAVHPEASGSATPVDVDAKGPGVDDVKIVAFRRNATELKAWNGSFITETVSSDGPFGATHMGLDGHIGNNWDMDGYIFYLAKYNGVMTDLQVVQEINRLNNLYGI